MVCGIEVRLGGQSGIQERAGQVGHNRYGLGRVKIRKYKVSPILEYLLEYAKDNKMAYTIIHTYDLKHILKFVKRAERLLLKDG